MDLCHQLSPPHLLQVMLLQLPGLFWALWGYFGLFSGGCCHSYPRWETGNLFSTPPPHLCTFVLVSDVFFLFAFRSPQGPPGPQGPIGYPGPRGVKVRRCRSSVHVTGILQPGLDTAGGHRCPLRATSVATCIYCSSESWASLLSMGITNSLLLSNPNLERFPS